MLDALLDLSIGSWSTWRCWMRRMLIVLNAFARRKWINHAAVEWRQDSSRFGFIISWTCILLLIGGRIGAVSALLSVSLQRVAWFCKKSIGVCVGLMVLVSCGMVVRSVSRSCFASLSWSLLEQWSLFGFGFYVMLLWFHPVLSDAQDYGRFGQGRTCCACRDVLLWGNDTRFRFLIVHDAS